MLGRAPLALMIAAGAAGLAACAGGPHPDAVRTALTPTQQFPIHVEQVPERLALAPHAGGLSVNQRVAIAAFVARWREGPPMDVLVQGPAAGADSASVARTVSDTVAALQSLGVPQIRVQVGAYDAAGQADAPVLASFQRYQARIPDCSVGWGNMTSTGSNRPESHFGCAVTANMATMVANPYDLVAPIPMDPSDATRRATVFERYRRGEVTSTARDDQAVGTVSNSVQ